MLRRAFPALPLASLLLLSLPASAQEPEPRDPEQEVRDVLRELQGLGREAPAPREAAAGEAGQPAAPAQGQAFLGVTVSEDDGAGVLVADVMPGLAAEQAGLREGDRLLALDGQELGSYDALARAIAGHRPGDAVLVRLARDGEIHELEITLGARPGAGQPAPWTDDAPDWGRELEDQEARARAWSEGFQQRMDQLRQEFDHHVRGLDGFLPRMRAHLEERAQEDPAARELLERLEAFRAETEAWREEHRHELEQLRARMTELRQQHVERLRSFAREARRAWQESQQRRGPAPWAEAAPRPGAGRGGESVEELRRRVEELQRTVDDLRRRLGEER